MNISLSSVLNGAIRSMQTAQFGLSLNNTNIAHANDTTYTRRDLSPQSLDSGLGPSVQRVRDAFTDDQYRLASANEGQTGMRSDIMTKVEDIFGDPVNGGVGTTLNQFFGGWQSLAENPADGVARLQVLSAGAAFTQQVKVAYGQLADLKASVNEQLANKVNTVNSNLQQIFELNKQIAQLKRSNQDDSGLQDKRDVLLDSLARMTGANSVEQADGTIRVFVGSTPVIDGPTIMKLSLVDTAQGPTPTWVGFATPTYSGSGELTGLLDVRNHDITDLMTDLSTLAKNVATQVNNLHGPTTAQGAAQNFFTIGGGPVDIVVNSVLGPGDVLPGFDPTAPSDGERARQIAALADSPMMSSVLIPGQTQTPRQFYRNLIGLLGNKAQEASQAQDIAKVHTEAADRQRQSEWGVSIDEETANLMLQQRAFQAAARVISVTDEMFDTLINRT